MATNRIRAKMSLAGYGQGAAEGVYEYDHVYRSSGNFVNTFQTVEGAAALDVSGLSLTGATIMIKNHSSIANVDVLVASENVFASIPPHRSMMWTNGSQTINVVASGGGTSCEIEILALEA